MEIFLKSLGAALVAVVTALPTSHLISPPVKVVPAVHYRVQVPANPRAADADDLVYSAFDAPWQSQQLPLPDPPAEDDSSGGSGGGSGPGSYQAPGSRPPLVIGSTQQALINQDRAGAGLPALTWNGCLASIAAANARRMANQGYISHAGGAQADLGCGLGYQAGENVGYWSKGICDGCLNSMFMGSAEHRANIMGPYRYVGTAWVVAANGYAYIAVEFG